MWLAQMWELLARQTYLITGLTVELPNLKGRLTSSLEGSCHMRKKWWTSVFQLFFVGWGANFKCAPSDFV
jgi:hypothetical protein